MELREQIKRQIRQIGQTVTVQNGDWTGMPYRAMIQNIRYKNKMYLQDTVTPLGPVSQDHYLYIGPFDHDLTGLPESTVLHTQRQDYHIIK
ncbi:MAG: hypothetical protein LIO46_05400, partial [Clostridiales bacterium]|nr:hypothetical protein [Clostridiales bacterium]